MVSKLPLPVFKTLEYFDKYDYPLTKNELVFWSGKYKLPNRKYYFLPGRESIVKLRKRREKISQEKWNIAKLVSGRIKRFPTVKAIYVTGSLSMNNADVNDDVDIMLITSVNTLWITRALINIFFWAGRRMPGQIQAPDKICINLWLDESALHITPHDAYRAHEVLQAKCVWERDNLHARFLAANAWVEKYLPNAYKNIQYSRINNQSRSIGHWKLNIGYLLQGINYIAFAVQYLYMKPKMTTERVSPHFAYFHPQKQI